MTPLQLLLAVALAVLAWWLLWDEDQPEKRR